MIPFIKPHFDEEDLEAVRQVMQSGWVAQGPKCEEFEEAVARYLGCKYAISVSNCTAALYLALLALGIGEGDEVIIPSFTFPATGLAVLHTGATPVLVDVNPVSYNTTAVLMEKKITKRTKALMPVHLFGLACDIDLIMDLADDYNLSVVEDAACSLGTLVYPNYMGTIGAVGCFSLQASKGITTGEGGLCVTNSEQLANRIRKLSSFGDERTFRRGKTPAPFYFNPRGFNFKMSDITAAIALTQLNKIDKLIDWRVKIAEDWYSIILKDEYLFAHITNVPANVFDRSHIYQSYVCTTTGGARQAVMQYFKDKGFSVGIGTHACHRYPDAFKPVVDKDGMVVKYPVSDNLFENSISLPRYYGLEVKEEWYKRR